MIPTPAINAAFERHYTVAEVAKLWGLSLTVTYGLFKHVDGVVRYNGDRSKGSRKYVTTRIPESVVVRVHAALSAQPEAFRLRKTTGAALGRKSSLAAASSRSL